MVTPRRDLATQHCKWSTQLYAATTQPSLLPSHLQQPLLPSFPPSFSPFLLSRRSPFSDLPIRAVDPSLRGGEVCDGCNLNSKPRLLVNWWSRTVLWNNHLFLVIWRSAVQIPAVATYLLRILHKILYTWCCSLCWPLQQKSRGWRTSRALPSVFSRCPNRNPTLSNPKQILFDSVPVTDPDPPDPHVFGPPPSIIKQKY